MMRFVEKSRMTIGQKMDLTSNEAVKQAVLGLSILLLISIKVELASEEIMIIPIKGLPTATFLQLVWLTARIPSPVAESFLSFDKGDKECIIKKYFSEEDRRTWGVQISAYSISTTFTGPINPDGCTSQPLASNA
jgi:hypothetical protein